jgi:hypothetical protein
MKVGKVELDDWIQPVVGGVQYNTWIRLARGSTYSGFSIFHTCIHINYGYPQKWFPEFCGELQFLEDSYQSKQFSSYEDAKEYVDRFLLQMDRLMVFA